MRRHTTRTDEELALLDGPNPYDPRAPITALPGTVEHMRQVQAKVLAGYETTYTAKEKIPDSNQGPLLRRQGTSGGSAVIIGNGPRVRGKCPHSRFCAILRWHREKLGYTRAGLAMMANLNMRTILRYELGQREPTLDALLQLAMALEVEVGELAGKPVQEDDEWEV